MSQRDRPTTRRGVEAVRGAIEEFELRQRIDEPDGSVRESGRYDLGWARGRIDAAHRAAQADVVTADEALGWLAEIVGMELPDDGDEDSYDRD